MQAGKKRSSRNAPIEALCLCLAVTLTLTACQVHQPVISGKPKPQKHLEAIPPSPLSTPAALSKAEAIAWLMQRPGQVKISFDYWSKGYTQSRLVTLSSQQNERERTSEAGADWVVVSSAQIQLILKQMKKAGYFDRAQLGGGAFPPDGRRTEIVENQCWLVSLDSGTRVK